MQALVYYAHKTVQLKEKKFKFWEICVEKISHMKPLHQGLKYFECSLFVVENHQQEASDEVHPLAVFNLRVIKSISL